MKKGRINPFSVRFLLVLSLGILVTGCIEQIEFDTEGRIGQLIVDGKITNGSGPHFLRLGIATSKTPLPVNRATVTLFDNEGNAENYYQVEEGVYRLEGYIVQGEAGKSYYIEIERANGAVYRSHTETIPTGSATGRAYYEFDLIEEVSSSGVTVEKNVVRLFADTFISESDQPTYLKWEVSETFKFTEFDFPDPFGRPPPVCYITDSPEPQNVRLFSGEDVNTDQIIGKEMATRVIDFTFYQRHAFSVIFSSISEGAYEYWRKVNQVVNSSGTIFDVPPATVPGNIYNVANEDEEIFGYFEAANHDTAHVFIYRVDLPVFVSNPCSNTVLRECTNCMLFDNSSSTPPSWWFE